MFGDQHIRCLEGWQDAYNLQPIKPSGVTRSFIGDLPSGRQVFLKRRDTSWDTCLSYDFRKAAKGSSPSMEAEYLWWEISQLLGGEWRKVPPCVKVYNHTFSKEQFADHDNFPSTGMHLVDDGCAYTFTGTLHLIIGDCTHEKNDVTHASKEQLEWSDFIRMQLLDACFFHGDRHSYNYLIDRSLVASDGEPCIYWIDNGRSLVNRKNHVTGSDLIKDAIWPRLQHWTRRSRAILYHLAAEFLDSSNQVDKLLKQSKVLYWGDANTNVMRDALRDCLDQSRLDYKTAGTPGPTTCRCNCCRGYRRHNGKANS